MVGIDPSTRRISAATLVPVDQRSDAAFVVSSLSLPQPGTDAARLALGQAALVPWLGALLRRWDPEVVVVEQPFAAAKHVPPVSYYTIGVLLAVLGTFRVRVAMVTPAQWKRAALGAGRGGVKKPGPKCPRGGSHTWAYDHLLQGPAVECLKCGDAYAVLTWARAAGYAGRVWDEADAIGIATAGGVLLHT